MNCLHCGNPTEFTVEFQKQDVPMCLRCQRWIQYNPIEANLVLSDEMEKLNGKLENSQQQRDKVGQ